MTHEFTLVASGLNPNEEGFEARFHAAGCDDATVSWQRGAILVDFSREAKTFRAAVEGAVSDVRATGATVVRVEPDHLVCMADVAERAGLTRAAISHYVAGGRVGRFPAPVARVTSPNPLWDWVSVAGWLRAIGRLDEAAVERAKVVRYANDVLLDPAA